LVKIWKIPTVESEIFLVLGSLDNSNFLEMLILLPLFNDRKISCIDKRHPYESDEKNCTKKGFGCGRNAWLKMHRKCNHT
jgi:hypothetical protein